MGSGTVLRKLSFKPLDQPGPGSPSSQRAEPISSGNCDERREYDDWTDQAFLLIHLDKTDRTELDELRQKFSNRRQRQQRIATTHAGLCAESGAAARLSLRQAGIRTATDLLKVYSKEVLRCGSLPQRVYVPPPNDQQLPLPESQLRLLVTVLGAEPGLVPIWNWQRNGVHVCQNQMRPPGPRPSPKFPRAA